MFWFTYKIYSAAIIIYIFSERLAQPFIAAMKGLHLNIVTVRFLPVEGAK